MREWLSVHEEIVHSTIEIHHCEDGLRAAMMGSTVNEAPIEGAKRGALPQLADRTVEADKILVF